MAEWFEWPSLRLSICFLFSALALQTMAAAWAAHQFFAGNARSVTWGLFSAALILMMPLHWRPLELALSTGFYDFTQAALSFGVALLLFLAVTHTPSQADRPRKPAEENRPPTQDDRS